MNIKRKPIIDTNIILRFLTKDVPAQADAVEKLFKESADNSLFVPDLVIAEIVFILQSKAYGKSREEIVSIVGQLVNFRKFDLDRSLILKTLTIFESSTLSFTDAYVIAHKELDRNEPVYTFDKKMHKLDRKSVRVPRVK